MEMELSGNIRYSLELLNIFFNEESGVVLTSQHVPIIMNCSTLSTASFLVFDFLVEATY